MSKKKNKKKRAERARLAALQSREAWLLDERSRMPSGSMLYSGSHHVAFPGAWLPSAIQMSMDSMPPLDHRPDPLEL